MVGVLIERLIIDKKDKGLRMTRPLSRWGSS
jgi:hypothetical protein